MPKIVQINTVCNGSTGRIMHDIELRTIKDGYEALAIVGRRSVYLDAPCAKYGNGISFWIHVGITTLFDRHGYGSYFQTLRMINRLRKEKPDIIHLHNIHGYYLHVPTLIKYLTEEYEGQVVWTMHDLWPVTGHCAYYTMAECNKWKSQCCNCPNIHRYPISFGLDNSKKNYADKKRMFTSFKDVHIVVPSMWMETELSESYVNKYPVTCISNGIDTNVFDYNRVNQMTDDVKAKYGIPKDAKILLAVASIWDDRKGLRDLIELSKVLEDDYRIVVVGLNKGQIKSLPANMIGIRRTENKDEIVSLYSSADIFINPSYEESFSLVTIEAQACGTPCIVLDTSAVSELVNDDNGIVLHSYSTEEYVKAINDILERDYSRESVRNTALKYTNDEMLDGYLSLYKELLKHV